MSVYKSWYGIFLFYSTVLHLLREWVRNSSDSFQKLRAGLKIFHVDICTGLLNPGLR